MMSRTDLENSIKFDVLTRWLLAEMEKDYISIDGVKKILNALGVETEGNEK